jgi:hypothetical protein
MKCFPFLLSSLLTLSFSIESEVFAMQSESESSKKRSFESIQDQSVDQEEKDKEESVNKKTAEDRKKALVERKKELLRNELLRSGIDKEEIEAFLNEVIYCEPFCEMLESEYKTINDLLS